MIVEVAGDGGFVSGPLVEIIGWCIVKGFAFFLRDPITRIKRVFLISGQARGPFLVEPLADLLDVLGIFRISKGFNIGRKFV